MSNYRTELESNNNDLNTVLNMVNELPEAITLPELTNPALPEHILEGYQVLDKTGKIITGTLKL